MFTKMPYLETTAEIAADFADQQRTSGVLNIVEPSKFSVHLTQLTQGKELAAPPLQLRWWRNSPNVSERLVF